MKFQTFYTEEARRDLRRVDFSTSARILKKIDFWKKQANPLRFAKPLREDLKGKYAFRVGDYRIIFTIRPNGEITILLILRIQHRREVYRSF